MRYLRGSNVDAASRGICLLRAVLNALPPNFLQ